MKRYRSYLEQQETIESQISGIRDAIKKLEYQNKIAEINAQYFDKTDPSYNEKINTFRDEMKGRTESIKKLNQQIADIKAGNKTKKIKPLKSISPKKR